LKLPNHREGSSVFRNPLTDSIIALVVLLVIFGPKRLPMLGRSLGEGIKGFRDSIGGKSSGEAQTPALITAEASTPGATATQTSPEQ
jgi:sec-independent protein translocase protein TatA